MSRNGRPTRASIPWVWLGLGALLTVGLLVGGVLWLLSYLAEPPAEVAAFDPTIIVLTAPPRPTTTPTVLRPTPTILPTSTPQPTIDVSVAPPELTVGYYATVRVLIVPEGSSVYVLEGPTDADSYLWWRIRLQDGTEGWAVGDFLAPAAGP